MGKLVRDKIPEIIQSNGETPKTRVLNEEEYQKELRRKLQEEVNEYLKEHSTEELADILEVMYHLDSQENIEKVRKSKHEKRGGFAKRIYLE